MAVLLVAAACSSDGSSEEAVELVEVYSGLEYYGACGNEPVTIGGTRYYPLLPEQLNRLDTSRYPDPDDLDPDDPGEAQGFAPLFRVAPPGPGDDIGRALEYADGIVRFDSDSGRTIWLTDQEQTYNWVC